MKETMSEALIATVGILTTAAAWMLGGRQKQKNEDQETLTKGADQLIDTSNKLLKIAEAAAKREQERTHNCEEKLREVSKRVECLERKLK